MASEEVGRALEVPSRVTNWAGVASEGEGDGETERWAGTSALLYTFWEPEMCRAGQRVLLTITGPGPSIFHFSFFYDDLQNTSENFYLSVGGWGLIGGLGVWGGV